MLPGLQHGGRTASPGAVGQRQQVPVMVARLHVRLPLIIWGGSRLAGEGQTPARVWRGWLVPEQHTAGTCVALVQPQTSFAPLH